jgi:hypothetical protein
MRNPTNHIKHIPEVVGVEKLLIECSTLTESKHRFQLNVGFRSFYSLYPTLLSLSLSETLRIYRFK